MNLRKAKKVMKSAICNRRNYRNGTIQNAWRSLCSSPLISNKTQAQKQSVSLARQYAKRA